MFCALHNYTYTVKPVYNLTCTGGERICCNGQGVGIHSACKQKHRNAKKAEKSTSDTTVKQITQVSDYTGVRLHRCQIRQVLLKLFNACIFSRKMKKKWTMRLRIIRGQCLWVLTEDFLYPWIIINYSNTYEVNTEFVSMWTLQSDFG